MKFEMVKIEELEKKIEQQEIKGIYLLYGEETFLLEQQLNKIKKKFGETIKGINYINIDENKTLLSLSDKSINPLLIDIDNRSTFKDKDYITKQIYWFCHLSFNYRV